MLKNYYILAILILCQACLGLPIPCDSIYRNETLSTKTKTFLCGDGGNIKYRCKKIGDCCEVGKNCEEDLKEEESKK